MDYSKRCLANVYLRQGFGYMRISDYNNAIRVFKDATEIRTQFQRNKRLHRLCK